MTRPLRYTLILSSATLFLSAFLLFSLEPLLAKPILPWFGGSAAVWSVCLVFYQSALLLGYLYASVLAHYLRPVHQATVHLAVLTLSAAFLPIGPTRYWISSAAPHPAWRILAMLTVTVAVPFITLSATSPLLQHWLARSGHETPYRFFAISNLASFLALFAYPLLVEPRMGVSLQTTAWSGGYIGFVLLCAATCILCFSSVRKSTQAQPEDRTYILPTRKLLWFSLSACGSILLLSITNHLSENVAAVPLLWVLPLAIYLLTFVLAFGTHRSFGRIFSLRLLAVTIGVLGYAVYDINAVLAVQASLPIFLAGLFFCCLFCHGELYRLRPPSGDLTSFYLLISAGGATGAVFVGLIAPAVFGGIYELPIALVFIAALVTLLTWEEGAWPLRLLWLGVMCSALFVTGANIHAYHANTLSLRRSFYGSLRVVQSSHAGPEQKRTLFHGIIEHGAQYILPPRRYRATTYYGPESGIGIVLRECVSSPKRVGVVGLGTGTIAAYGKAGDSFRFYEINDQVAEAAHALFYYLRESKAETGVIIGDARLSLARESAPPFDVLALDAFSGDAIPVHLLTKEAMSIYWRHLRPDGVLAVHVSNVFLKLAPVVKQLAESAGYHAVLVRNHDDTENDVLAADWVLVTNNDSVLSNDSIKVHSSPIDVIPHLRLWTDDNNDLIEILKGTEERRSYIRR